MLDIRYNLLLRQYHYTSHRQGMNRLRLDPLGHRWLRKRYDLLGLPSEVPEKVLVVLGMVDRKWCSLKAVS
jgi:hypothetical protein